MIKHNIYTHPSCICIYIYIYLHIIYRSLSSPRQIGLVSGEDRTRLFVADLFQYAEKFVLSHYIADGKQRGQTLRERRNENMKNIHKNKQYNGC